MVNHSDKVNIITKVYGDKINTNFDSIVNQFGSDGALYALILAQEQLTIMMIRIIGCGSDVGRVLNSRQTYFCCSTKVEKKLQQMALSYKRASVEQLR